MRRLTTADAQLDPETLASMASSGAIVLRDLAEQSVSDGVLVDSGPSLAELAADAVEEAVAEADNDEAEPIDETGGLLQALLGTQDTVDEPPTGFIISISMRGACRRLHFAGGCFRVAGEHYKTYESFGQSCPSAELYSHRCKDCFPNGAVAAAREEVDMEVSEGADASASSSSAASAAGEASD